MELDPVEPTVAESELWTFVVPGGVEPRFLERISDDTVVFVGEDLQTREVVFIGLDGDGREIFSDSFLGIEGPIFGASEEWEAPYADVSWPAGTADIPPWAFSPRLVTDADALGEDELLLVIASSLFTYHPSSGVLQNLNVYSDPPIMFGTSPAYFKSATSIPGGGFAAAGQGPDHGWSILGYDSTGALESCTNHNYPVLDPIPEAVLYRESTGHFFLNGTVPGSTMTYPSTFAVADEGNTLYVPTAGSVDRLEHSFVVSYGWFPTTSEYLFYMWLSCLTILEDDSMLAAIGLHDAADGVDPPQVKFLRRSIDGLPLSVSTFDAPGYGITCSSAPWNGGAYIAWGHDFYQVNASGAPALVFQEPEEFLDIAIAAGGSITALLGAEDGAAMVRAYSLDPLD